MAVSRPPSLKAMNPLAYRSWSGMLGRCFDPTNAAWPNYGGRGIMVCDRWFSFERFLADMGERQAGQYSIERVDVEGDYEPSNCVWLPMNRQSRNQRRTIRVRDLHADRPVVEVAEELGLKASRLRLAVKRGNSIFSAVEHATKAPAAGTPVIERIRPRWRPDPTPVACESIDGLPVVGGSYLIGHNGEAVDARYWAHVT